MYSDDDYVPYGFTEIERFRKSFTPSVRNLSYNFEQ